MAGPRHYIRAENGEFSSGGVGKAVAAFRRRRVAATELDGPRTQHDASVVGVRRRSESSARARYSRLTDTAHSVHSAYSQRQMGMRLRMDDRALIEYQSPRSRDAAMARTGTVVMPTGEALRLNLGVVRSGQRGAAGRVGSKRTLAGKAVAVRSPFGGRFRNLAGRRRQA